MYPTWVHFKTLAELKNNVNEKPEITSLPPIIGTDTMFSVFISITESSDPPVVSPLRLNSHRMNHLQSSSVKYTWGVQTYFNVLSTPHRWSWQLKHRRKITSLGLELIAARVLAYKIFTADISSHGTRKAERVICPSVILPVVLSALFQASWNDVKQILYIRVAGNCTTEHWLY